MLSRIRRKELPSHQCLTKYHMCHTLTRFRFDDFSTTKASKLKCFKSTIKTKPESECSIKRRCHFRAIYQVVLGNSGYIVHRLCAFWIQWLSDTRETSRSKWFMNSENNFRINVLCLVHRKFLTIVRVTFLPIFRSFEKQCKPNYTIPWTFSRFFNHIRNVIADFVYFLFT